MNKNLNLALVLLAVAANLTTNVAQAETQASALDSTFTDLDVKEVVIVTPTDPNVPTECAESRTITYVNSVGELKQDTLERKGIDCSKS